MFLYSIRYMDGSGNLTYDWGVFRINQSRGFSEVVIILDFLIMLILLYSACLGSCMSASCFVYPMSLFVLEGLTQSRVVFLRVPGAFSTAMLLDVLCS